MKKDIETREDIVLLVNTFYDLVNQNKQLGFIFNDIAQVDWDTHLPKMYSFWSSILLGEKSFSGNPMEKHVALSKTTPMTEDSFAEWRRLFNQTVDDLFQGAMADEAKTRAENIARLMLYKIQVAEK